MRARLRAYRIGYAAMPRWKVAVVRVTWRLVAAVTLALPLTYVYSMLGVG